MLIDRIKDLFAYSCPGNSSMFWHGDHPYVEYKYNDLTDYYIDFTCRPANRHCFLIDGVPHLKYSFSEKPLYNSCAVAQWGLGCWQVVKRTNNHGESNFSQEYLRYCHDGIVNSVASLLNNFTFSSPNHGFWEYSFDLPAYSQSAPWRSAIAQGQAISFLVRALEYAEDQDYCISVIHAGFTGLMTPTEERGLLYKRKRLAFLEEIVSSPHSIILDGSIYALLGVFDYYFFKGNDPLSDPSVLLMITSIAKALRLYDLGYWSRADIMPRRLGMPASPYYHQVHISQLQVMFSLTSNPAFAEYSEKWSMYSNSTFMRFKALIHKIVFKLSYY